MIQEYYIISGDTRTGPFDTVSLVRKIRNGSLTANTTLQLGDSSESKPANQWPDLVEFFGDKKEDRAAMSDRSTSREYSLGGALQSGWYFLQQNQYSTVFSGLFVLVVILAVFGINSALPPSLCVIGYMVCFVLGHFMFSCYMLIILRMTRNQPVDMSYFLSKVGPATTPLLLSSLLISIPAMLGLALLASTLPEIVVLIGLIIFAVPGLFALALHVFSAPLIIDRDASFWDSMESSRKIVLGSGLEHAGIIYALLVINFIAGLCAMLPLIITLPITMGALAEIYEEKLG